MPPRKPTPETPLYVRLPNDAVDKLDRAAAVLGMHKKDLVARLVTKYIDPDSRTSLSALGAMASQRRPPTTDGGPMVGSYSFQPYEPPEIMNAEQAGKFLQIAEAMVIELAEAGKLPGKRLGPVWRFSRDALVAWLATPERR
jgi:hypothetical protein